MVIFKKRSRPPPFEISTKSKECNLSLIKPITTSLWRCVDINEYMRFLSVNSSVPSLFLLALRGKIDTRRQRNPSINNHYKIRPKSFLSSFFFLRGQVTITRGRRNMPHLGKQIHSYIHPWPSPSFPGSTFQQRTFLFFSFSVKNQRDKTTYMMINYPLKLVSRYYY